MQSLLTYLRETRAEMRHVSWPTQAQVIGYTLIVVVISLAVAFLLGFLDFGFARLLELILVR